LKGVAKRAAFVVGTDGKIAYAWVSEDAGVQPDLAAIKDAAASCSTIGS
jgi:peroxiredoxin